MKTFRKVDNALCAVVIPAGWPPDRSTQVHEMTEVRLLSLTIEEILNRDEPDAMLAFGI